MNPQTLLQQALAARLLPPDATLPEQSARPWPVIVLTGIGAWLAVIPLSLMIGLLLDDALRSGLVLYLLGVALLVAAVIVLRQTDLPLFVEQLALPALMLGGGCLAFALARDESDKTTLFVMLVVSLVLSWQIEKGWLRALLGALAAVLALWWVAPTQLERDGTVVFWFASHVLLLLWLAASHWQNRFLLQAERASLAVWLEKFSDGWIVALLLVLIGLSGSSFLLGHTNGASVTLGLMHARSTVELFQSASSVALAVLAVLLFARQQALARPQQWLLAGPALALALLAWQLPGMGMALLMLVCLLGLERRALASLAALAVLWIIGSFYYLLSMTLSQKALLLCALGAMLGLGAFLTRGQSLAPAAANSPPGTPPPLSMPRMSAPLLAGLAGALCLLLVNFQIWQKQDLITRGQPVWIKLLPVDPRSLMQGDFMRLNFAVPQVSQALTDSTRPHAVAGRDARGVATLTRIWHEGDTLAAGELRIELTPKNGQWVVVTDAWFFEEGKGAPLELAKYGEFRVLPNGRALLVGLADEQLKPLTRAP